MSDLVMLDFDGVIADSLEPTEMAVRSTFAEHGHGELNERITTRDLCELNWFDALKNAGVPLEVVSAIDDHVADLTSRGVLRPYPDIGDVIERLSQYHKIIIMTSNRSDIVEDFLVQWGISGIRETLGGDKGQSKVMKIGLALQEYAPSRAWFVGDTSGDIVEGREAGVRTIAAGWGWHSHDLLQAASPDYYVHSPQELLDLLLE